MLIEEEIPQETPYEYDNDRDFNWDSRALYEYWTNTEALQAPQPMIIPSPDPFGTTEGGRPWNHYSSPEPQRKRRGRPPKHKRIPGYRSYNY